MNLSIQNDRRFPVARVLLSLLAIALLGIAACSDGGGGGPSCPAGKESCACKSGNVCDDGLVCQDGKCAVDTCPQGSDGCPCYPNNSCDGTLTCNNGVCEDASCPAGTEGCACLNGTTCNGTLECVSGKCQKPDCPVGTEGCPCDGGTCQGDLVCSADVCVSATEGVKVTSGDVRSCDVLFDAGAVDVGSVSFNASVKGGFRKDKTLVAITFTATADAALTAPVGLVKAADGSAADVAAITPSKVECFDRLGKAIADPGLSLR